MAASARAFPLSRFTYEFDLFRSVSLKPPPQLSPSPLLLHPQLPAAPGRLRRRSQASPPPFNCVFSSGGESVADDFVSTRKSAFRREFSVLANLLKQIEPLDTSVIAKGVSAASKDSMKRTISTMLGLLPSHQFAVSVRASRSPLHRLLSSSIITGYTLWNAEYRVSLMRNFDNSPGSAEVASASCDGRVSMEKVVKEGREGLGLEKSGAWGETVSRTPQFLGDLSPEVLSYIEKLQSELATVEKKLDAQRLESIHLASSREENNDLLDYLRSLEPEMVIELSKPSSSEVEDIIQQLVQSIIQKISKGDTSSHLFEESVVDKTEICSDEDIKKSTAIRTSRDYLARLLFWCMLLGHHMRGLEYRLHLSCIVGLL